MLGWFDIFGVLFLSYCRTDLATGKGDELPCCVCLGGYALEDLRR